MLTKFLSNLSSSFHQPSDCLFKSFPWNLHKLFSIFNSLIVGIINFSLQVRSIFFSLINHWSQDLIGIVRTNRKYFSSSIFQWLPLQFCLWSYMSGLSLIYFLIYIVSSYLYTTFNECPNSGKDSIEEFSWCSDCFFDVIWIIYLLCFKVRIMLFNSLFDLICFIYSLKLAVVDQFGSVGEDLVEIVDCWWCIEEWYGTESTFEVRKDIRNSFCIVYLHEVDVLMNSIVKTAYINKISWFWFIAFKLRNFACSWGEESLFFVEESVHEDMIDF